MKIKIGDLVRVSGAAPKMYLSCCGGLFASFAGVAIEIEGDNVLIGSSVHIEPNAKLAIPTKYLIKVDTEAKEPKFKKGDRVKYIGKEHPEYWDEIFTVDGEIFYNDYHKNMQISRVRCEKYNLCNVPLSDLEPYAEPTEQAEASADVLGEFTPIPRFANPIIGFEQAYWRKYEADLAKVIAVKVANKYNDPEQAAEYAVHVAKAVVENLKKK